MKKREKQRIGLTIAKPKTEKAWNELCSESRGGDKGPYHATQHRRLERALENVEGKVRAVTRVVDTVGELYRARTIDYAMYAEAQDFKRWFDVAGMSGMKGSKMDGIIGASTKVFTEAEMIVHAKNELWRAYSVLGGAESVMSRAMHQIVGHGVSLRGMEGARQGNRRGFWLGALIAALETLSRHRAGIFEKRC